MRELILVLRWVADVLVGGWTPADSSARGALGRAVDRLAGRRIDLPYPPRAGWMRVLRVLGEFAGPLGWRPSAVPVVRVGRAVGRVQRLGGDCSGAASLGVARAMPSRSRPPGPPGD